MTYTITTIKKIYDSFVLLMLDNVPGICLSIRDMSMGDNVTITQELDGFSDIKGVVVTVKLEGLKYNIDVEYISEHGNQVQYLSIVNKSSMSVSLNDMIIEWKEKMMTEYNG